MTNRNLRNILSIFVVLSVLQQQVHAFWDGEKWWFMEHQFKHSDATFEINKAYSGGGVTDYTFKMKNIQDDIRGLRVAFQWIYSDETYKGMVFQLKVPETGEKLGGKVLEQMNIAQYYPNQNNDAQTEYLKNIVVGNYVTDEEPNVVNLVTRVNRNGDLDGSEVEISFRMNGHEPLGKSKFWMAWEQYDEYVACIPLNTCLTIERVNVRATPFDYYNGENFGNQVSRGFLLTLYWIIEGSGIFWLLGTPLNLFIYILMNLYIQFVTFIGFFTILVAAGGGYDEEQTKLYSFGNWFLELVMYWSGGTFLFSTILFSLVNFIPFLGPAIGIVLILIIEPLITL